MSTHLENAAGPVIAQPPWYVRYSLVWWVLAAPLVLGVCILLFPARLQPFEDRDIVDRLEDSTRGDVYLAPVIVWAEKAHLEKYNPVCTSTGRCTLTYFNFGGVHGVQLRCTAKGCYPVGGW